MTIPDSVTEIGYGAFKDCTGLTSVTIPGSVDYIGNWAFDGCTGLTSVTIPNSVKYIGDWAFRDCYGLTSVTMPGSVECIDNGAFRDCTGLETVTLTGATYNPYGNIFGKAKVVCVPNENEIIFAPQKCLEKIATNAAQTADDYNSVGQLLNNAKKKIEQRQEKSKNSRKENCLNI